MFKIIRRRYFGKTLCLYACIYAYYVFLCRIIFKICLAIASDFRSYNKIAIPTVNNNCKRPCFSGDFVQTTTKTNTCTENIINSISVVLTITIGYSDVLTGRVNNLTVNLVLHKSYFSPLTINHSSRRSITCSSAHYHYRFIYLLRLSFPILLRVFRFSSDSFLFSIRLCFSLHRSLFPSGSHFRTVSIDPLDSNSSIPNVINVFF